MVELLQNRIEADGVAGFDGFKHGDFEQNFLGRGVAQPKFGIGQDFENSCERFDIGQPGLFFQRRDFGFGDFKQIQVAARNLENEQVAEMIQQIGKQSSEILAVLRQFVQPAQRGLNFAGKNGLAQTENLAFGGEAEHGEHIVFLDFVAAKADELVERGFGVAHGAVRAARDGVERRFVNFHLFQFRDVREVFGDERGRDPAQVKTLATRENRRQNLLRVGRGEHEFHVRRRLFERLEQRVERRRRKHVDFVNDVDFERRIGGRVFAGLAQFADLFDAVVARAVNFQNIERAAFGNFNAARILVVEIDFRTAGAIQTFGEDAGDGRLARATRATKQVGVRDALLFDGVGERLRDVFLPDDIGKPLRTVFSGDYLIGHTKANEE